MDGEIGGVFADGQNVGPGLARQNVKRSRGQSGLQITDLIEEDPRLSPAQDVDRVGDARPDLEPGARQNDGARRCE